MRRVQVLLSHWDDLNETLEEAETGLALCLESEPADAELIAEVETHCTQLEERITQLELAHLLGGDHDAGDAIVIIHAGAGGTEAADWAAMLWRMYQRWCEQQGYQLETLDSQSGDEAGLKSATFNVRGAYAYGYLKTEVGIHRLVRISPFDAGKRRHTSFASVFVYPDVTEEVHIDIAEADLRIETYRAQGAGGQHVNTTDSAVRITHLPSGIVVQCQNERSQHKNRSAAIKVLRARLYEREMAARQEEQDRLNASKRQIAWGSQIRSYVLHPYQMVKDHRTQVEIGNTRAVLDGDITPFIQKALLQGL